MIYSVLKVALRARALSKVNMAAMAARYVAEYIDIDIDIDI